MRRLPKPGAGPTARPAHRLLAVTVTVTLTLAPSAPAVAPPGAAVDRPRSAVGLAGLVRAPSATCGAPPAAAPAPTGTPWTGQRYPADRIAPLATGAGITVAVIDSGVDRRHPQLAGQIGAGTDYLDPGGDGRRDCAGHGTAVASIIAATPRSRAPLRGLAPGCRILPVRVSEQQVVDGKESGRTVAAGQFAQSIRWAVDHGARVINLSVVLYEDSSAVRGAIAYTVARDVVVVAAVGNLHDGGDPRPYPAAYPGVVGVGAIGPDGTRSPFSQVGSYVDLVAPGGAVLTASVGQGFGQQDGTSYAAPFVSATAALLRQYRPELTAAQVVGRILATTDPAPAGGRGDAYGSGMLNPYRAVTETGAVVHEEAVPALPPEREDPAVTAREARRGQARQRGLLIGGAAAVAALVALLTAAVVPRGARRRWRPGSDTH